MSYPCGCTPSEVVTPSCPSGNCMKAPNITIDPLDSVMPCGGTFSIDIGALSDFSVCSGSVVWELLSYDDDVFTNVELSSSGVLSGATTTEAKNHVDEFFEFVYKVMCPDSYLSVMRKVRMPIKNGCLTTVCTTGQICNPCTGLCITDAPDVILT